MKKILLLSALGLIVGQSRAQQAIRRPGTVSDSVIVLSNGWSLTPAGHGFRLGDLPLNIAVSANRRWAAVTNNGQSTQTLQLIDVAAEKVIDSVIISKSWLGLKFSSTISSFMRRVAMTIAF